MRSPLPVAHLYDLGDQIAMTFGLGPILSGDCHFALQRGLKYPFVMSFSFQGSLFFGTPFFNEESTALMGRITGLCKAH